MPKPWQEVGGARIVQATQVLQRLGQLPASPQGPAL